METNPHLGKINPFSTGFAAAHHLNLPKNPIFFPFFLPFREVLIPFQWELGGEQVGKMFPFTLQVKILRIYLLLLAPGGGGSLGFPPPPPVFQNRRGIPGESGVAASLPSRSFLGAWVGGVRAWRGLRLSVCPSVRGSAPPSPQPWVVF